MPIFYYVPGTSSWTQASTSCTTAATAPSSYWYITQTAAATVGTAAYYQNLSPTALNCYLRLVESPQQAAVLNELANATAPGQWNEPPIRLWQPAAPAVIRRQDAGYYEAMARREYERHERDHRRRIEQAHSYAAHQRALELLLQHLTPAQRETFERNKWFVVEGGKSKQRYRIHHKGHMVANIDVLDGDDVTHRLCGHCDLDAVPIADQLIAQKMMLEYDEDAFLALANRHRPTSIIERLVA